MPRKVSAGGPGRGPNGVLCFKLSVGANALSYAATSLLRRVARPDRTSDSAQEVQDPWPGPCPERGGESGRGGTPEKEVGKSREA